MRDSMKYWKKPKMKCDIFQGYYFGKPMGKDDFERMFLISWETCFGSTLLGSSGH